MDDLLAPTVVTKRFAGGGKRTKSKLNKMNKLKLFKLNKMNRFRLIKLNTLNSFKVVFILSNGALS